MNRTSKGLIAGSVALTALATGYISQFEGRELRAYQDIVHVWTICDGETKGVKRGDVATPAECDAMLARNLVTYEAGLDRCLVATVPGKVKVAFLSWAYNVGIGAACSSTLVRKANAGDIVGACNELPKWNRAGGKVVPGLSNRRAAERALCLEGAAG
jgi:GH24 family phage-related lysozyme (muramidase)